MVERNGAGKIAGVVTLVTMAIWMGLAPKPAGAHTGEQSYVYIEVFDDGIEGRVEFPIRDVNEVFDLSIPTEPEDAALEALAPEEDRLWAYAEEHLRLGPGVDEGDESAAWELTPLGMSVLELEDGLSYAIFDFEVEGEPVPAPRQFGARYDGFLEELDDYSALLIIATDFGSGTFNNEADHLLVFDRGDDRGLVDLDDSSWFKGMWGVIELGIEHIRIGTDHILFVLALVLPSVMVWSDTKKEWEPAPSFKSSLWRVLKIATFFTIAHSITLALGGLEIITLPGKLVETIIAISIILAAFHNLRPVAANREWLLAFVFGLFHGFGFAGLLGDLGLDRVNRVTSLLGFNLGVEIGQVAIILLIFPTLFLLRKLPAYIWILRIGSILLAAVAAFWVYERLAETEVGISDLIDPLFKFPRALVPLGALFLLAAGLNRWWEARAGGTPAVAGVADAAAAATDADQREVVEIR